jgi:hypothetical protein
MAAFCPSSKKRGTTKVNAVTTNDGITAIRKNLPLLHAALIHQDATSIATFQARCFRVAGPIYRMTGCLENKIARRIVGILPCESQA